MEREQSSVGTLFLSLPSRWKRASEPLRSCPLVTARPKGVCPCYSLLSISHSWPKEIFLGLTVPSSFCL